MCSHTHRVEDTRKRSLLKSLTGRALEISIGSFIISYVFTADLATSTAVAVTNETICAVLCYVNDRLWNKVQWGRHVEDMES